MRSFTSVFAVASAITGAFALPTDIAKRSAGTIARRTSPGQGTSGGYFYQFWTEGGGSVSYTNGAAGEYSVTWSDVQDFTAGKGWQTGAPRAIAFEGSFDPGNNGYLSVYTWSTSVETYILENYGPYNPGASATHMGTLDSDGSTYDIYRDYPGTNPSDSGFVQYWSIRQDKRSSGTVTTANHYNKWNALGMKYDPSGSYQIVSTEGFGSTGSSKITVSEGTSDSSSAKAAASSSAAVSAAAASSAPAPSYAPSSIASAANPPPYASTGAASSAAPYPTGSAVAPYMPSGTAPVAPYMPSGTAPVAPYAPTSTASSSSNGGDGDCDVVYIHA